MTDKDIARDFHRGTRDKSQKRMKDASDLAGAFIRLGVCTYVGMEIWDEQPIHGFWAFPISMFASAATFMLAAYLGFQIVAYTNNIAMIALTYIDNRWLRRAIQVAGYIFIGFALTGLFYVSYRLAAG